MMECFRLNGLLERTTPVDMQTVFSFSYPSTFSTLLSFCIIYRTLPRDGVKKSKTIMISRFFMRTKLHSPHTRPTERVMLGWRWVQCFQKLQTGIQTSLRVRIKTVIVSHLQLLDLSFLLIVTNFYLYHTVFFLQDTPLFFFLFVFVF